MRAAGGAARLRPRPRRTRPRSTRSRSSAPSGRRSGTRTRPASRCGSSTCRRAQQLALRPRAERDQPLADAASGVDGGDEAAHRSRSRPTSPSPSRADPRPRLLRASTRWRARRDRRRRRRRAVLGPARRVARRPRGEVFAAIAEAMAAVRAEIPDEDRRETRSARRRCGARSARRSRRGHERSPSCAARGTRRRSSTSPARRPTTRRSRPCRKPVKIDRDLGAVDVRAASPPRAATAPASASPGWYEHLWSGQRAARRHVDGQVGPRRSATRTSTSRSAHLIEADAPRRDPRRDARPPRCRSSRTSSRRSARSSPSAPTCRWRSSATDLIVGDAMGKVPERRADRPARRRLRARQQQAPPASSPDDGARSVDLDLRTETDLGRSHLLHRLDLLDIDWGAAPRASAAKARHVPRVLDSCSGSPSSPSTSSSRRATGTRSRRRRRRRPSEVAAATRPAARRSPSSLEAVLLADLPDAAAAIVERLGAVAAVAADVPALMAALPPLARVMRYGNVRGHRCLDGRGIVDASWRGSASGSRRRARRWTPTPPRRWAR